MMNISLQITPYTENNYFMAIMEGGQGVTHLLLKLW